jgi:hypothetical protein
MEGYARKVSLKLYGPTKSPFRRNSRFSKVIQRNKEIRFCPYFRRSGKARKLAFFVENSKKSKETKLIEAWNIWLIEYHK